MIIPPSPQSEAALHVIDTLRAAGHRALLAGGCVRDLLLQLSPKDFDVATDAPPARVREIFPNTQAVGAAFGVILVRHRRVTVEVATFRSDGVYTDGRRPETVRFTTAEEDAQRRDFTINGLFYDPAEEVVIDYVGGQADLRAGVVRAIGRPQRRFAEDHLRMLRAVRFACRLGFMIDPATGGCIRAGAAGLERISAARVGDEVRRMLSAGSRRRAWRMLCDLRLGRVILRNLPGLPADEGTVDQAERLDQADPAGRSNLADRAQHADRADHADHVVRLDRPAGGVLFDALPDDLPTEQPLQSAGLLAIAAISFLAKGDDPAEVIKSIDGPAASQIAAGLRKSTELSNDERDLVRYSIAAAGRLVAAKATAAQLKRLLATPAADTVMTLLTALTANEVESKLARQASTTLAELHRLRATDFAPPPLVTGDDLIRAGLAPGWQFKEILYDLYDRQLEGELTGKSQALQAALAAVTQK